MIKRKNSQFGYTLVEVIIALGVFVIVSVAVNLLIIQALDDSFASSRRAKGLFLAKEGMEVVRGIRNTDFDLLVNGTYGVSRNVGVWSFVPNQDEEDGYIRYVTISSVDGDSKLIESTVHWTAMNGREQTSNISMLLTDWKQTGGNRGDIEIDTALVALESGTELSGLSIENVASSSVIVHSIIAEWTGEGLLYEIVIDGEYVYSVAPEDGAPSGSLLDVTDIVLDSNYGEVDMLFVFDSLDSQAEVSIVFELTDDSKKYVYVSL